MQFAKMGYARVTVPKTLVIISSPFTVPWHPACQAGKLPLLQYKITGGLNYGSLAGITEPIFLSLEFFIRIPLWFTTSVKMQ